MAARLFLALSALACSSAAIGQTTTTQLEAVSGPAEVDKTTQTEDVRFRTERYDRMTVPVRLSGTGPYQFLVDTGANRTAISRQLAAQLKLVPGETAKLHSVVGPSIVQTAAVPSLQLTHRAVKVADAPLLDASDMQADGILGTDALRSQRVMFDFQARTMSIVPSATPDFRSEPGTIVIQGNRRNGRLLLTEAKANGNRLTVVVDTGSQISVGNSALRRKLIGDRPVQDSERVDLISVTGEKIAGDQIFVRQLEIGGVTLRNLAIVFVDAHTFKHLKLDRKPALLLGMNAIRAFKKVSIDFARRRLRVVVPEQSSLDVRMASAGAN